MIRRTAYFSGNVQGVGFRYTAQRIAGGFAVAGYVRNLSDGRVELVAEGDASELDSFIAAVRGEMRSYIAHQTEADGVAEGSFNGFEVRR